VECFGSAGRMCEGRIESLGTLDFIINELSFYFLGFNTTEHDHLTDFVMVQPN